jgi:hypothetical protein
MGVIALALLVYAFKKLKEATILPPQELQEIDHSDPNDFHKWITDNTKE